MRWVSGLSGACVRFIVRSCPICCPDCPICCPVCPVHSGQYHYNCPVMSRIYSCRCVRDERSSPHPAGARGRAGARTPATARESSLLFFAPCPDSSSRARCFASHAIIAKRGPRAHRKDVARGQGKAFDYSEKLYWKPTADVVPNSSYCIARWRRPA